MVHPSQPNILFVVSDEERRNDWLAGKVSLPAHERLRRDGMSFTRHFTHSSPCSPSRASLYTGRYLAEHGVVDNVSFPAHVALDPTIPTIGQLLSDNGYHSSYLGKWHLSHDRQPDMAAYGYRDWRGDDGEFTGSPWSGRHFDPIIAAYAVDWLHRHAGSSQPWFLTVALVNPHDVMWFPLDHLSYQANHPHEKEGFDFVQQFTVGDLQLAPPPEDYPQRFDRLPSNFDDDLHTKPAVQRAWRHVRNTEHMVGAIDQSETGAWLRQLDYYAWLHEKLDVSLATILGALDDLGIYDETVIVYTSDHGDACGAHGLRAKLPCVYEEVMGVPLIVKAPGVPAGTQTSALSTHVDLAATLCALGGVDPVDTATLSGTDLSPVLVEPTMSVRDFVFFAQDSAQSELLRNTRYAVRGFYDGTTKYARYYGVGGGVERQGARSATAKVFDIDAPFDENDHEWYDHTNDPDELVNLAHDRGRRHQLRALFDQLLEIEATELHDIP
ncbi:MAG: sulfatase-like hydrolase/transferase [Acidimicrobiales bacterium]